MKPASDGEYYVAFGFSNDARIGGDLVFTCKTSTERTNDRETADDVISFHYN